ncbi:MAG: D-alanine--poly(phosphoribitol) ligase, partial [Candidatus Methanofastidiosa archaeon]|nr:D-alanine--poly(phosphoribitol) ligase [Candidatus Methanofastidiosa archaeon]
GKVMEGIKAIIMDKEQEIHSKNQKGELCISGDQLTPGYWKNPEKSRESFFEREYYGQTTRFYKTGDICFFDEDGDIMLTGRLDNQIKIQGYRIELGEIEFLAREYANGSAAVAVTVYKLDGDLEIALAIEDSECDIDGLIKFLKSKLPSYMIPSRIRFITPLPLNYNGKIDRIKLQTYFN